jgi:hypothetical protein
MRAMALSMLLLPSIAVAQPALPPNAPPPPPPSAAAEPSECVTTTTVRCTGAAAPYAVQPQTVVVPAPPPAPPPPPQVIVLDPRKLVGDGWKVVQSPDGCWWRERKLSTASPGMWGGGLALFLTSYLAGAIGGMAGQNNPLGFWPVLGPLTSSAFSHDNAQILWAVDGVAQAGGFVLFLVGLAAGPDKIERQPLTFGPTSFIGGGTGVALQTRF